MADTGVSWGDAFQAEVPWLTGGYIAVQKSLKKKLYYLVKTKEAHSFWLGIASGVSGCQARWDQKYKNAGMNMFYILYESESDTFRKNLEEDLIDWAKKYKYNPENINSGGGGPIGSPPYFVYIALRY